MWISHIGTLLTAFILASLPAGAQQPVPMTVAIFNSLKNASEASSDGKWPRIAYETYLGAVAEQLLDADLICIPKSQQSAPVNDVFRRIGVEIEIALRGAEKGKLVLPIIKEKLGKVFPC